MHESSMSYYLGKIPLIGGLWKSGWDDHNPNLAWLAITR